MCRGRRQAGLQNLGTLTIRTSTGIGNAALNTGGIANGSTLTVSDMAVRDNSGTGIGNGGPLTVRSSTVRGNRTLRFAAGITNFDRMTSPTALSPTTPTRTAVTLDTYSHAAPTTTQEAAERLGHLFKWEA